VRKFSKQIEISKREVNDIKRQQEYLAELVSLYVEKEIDEKRLRTQS
jgi:hypothetical protein